MTDDMIDQAARLWRQGHDTMSIAHKLQLRESEVYNQLWRIRMRAQYLRAA